MPANSRPWTRLAAFAPDRRAVIFTVNNCLAVSLALFVSLGLALPHPFWAMVTVLLVANPLSGALRSKALYRVAGTIVGAAVSVLLVPPLQNAPVLLSLALSAWVGFCLFISLLERKPNAYAFMLSGYTASIVAFTGINAPAQIFETAMARVEEISIGILSVSVVHSLFAPNSVTAFLKDRVRGLMVDVRHWLSRDFSGDPDDAVALKRRRFAADITELHLLATHLPFDTACERLDHRLIAAIEQQFSRLLPLAAECEDRLEQLKRLGRLDDELQTLVSSVFAWIAATAPPSVAADELMARCADLAARRLAGAPDWRALLAASVCAQLGAIVDVLAKCRALAAAVMDPGLERGLAFYAAELDAGPRLLDRDYGLAAFSGLAATAVVMSVCVFWTATAWPNGGLAASFASIGCCLFAASPDPEVSLKRMTLVVLASQPVAAFYALVILPSIDGYVALALVLAPVVAVISYFQLRPATNVVAIAAAFGFFGTINITETYSNTLETVVNGGMAEFLGLLMAYIAIRLIRMTNFERGAKRLEARIRRDLLGLARSSGSVDQTVWTRRAVDRLGLITQYLSAARAGGRGDTRIGAALVDVRAGLSLTALHQVRRRASGRGALALDIVFERTARRLSAGPGDDFDGRKLWASIDHALRTVSRTPDAAGRGETLIVLTNLRRVLLPAAPGFSAPAPAPARVAGAAANGGDDGGA